MTTFGTAALGALHHRQGAPGGGCEGAGSPAQRVTPAFQKSKSAHLPRTLALSPGARAPGSAISMTFSKAGVRGEGGVLMSFNSLPKFSNFLGWSARREESHQALPIPTLTSSTPPPRAGSGRRTSRTDPSRDGVGGAGVGPASAAARRRLGRARLLRFGANYKVSPAATSPGTARRGEAGALSPAAQLEAPQRRRRPQR